MPWGHWVRNSQRLVNLIHLVGVAVAVAIVNTWLRLWGRWRCCTLTFMTHAPVWSRVIRKWPCTWRRGRGWRGRRPGFATTRPPLLVMFWVITHNRRLISQFILFQKQNVMYHATLSMRIGVINDFMDRKMACNLRKKSGLSRFLWGALGASKFTLQWFKCMLTQDFQLQKYGRAQRFFLQGDIPLCIHYSLLNMTLTDPPSMAMSLGGCFWASIQCKEAAGRCYKAPRHRMATYFIEWAAKLWRGWGYCCFLMTSVKKCQHLLSTNNPRSSGTGWFLRISWIMTSALFWWVRPARS